MSAALAQRNQPAGVLRGAIANLPAAFFAGLVQSADAWLARAVRNSLTHECPDRPQIRTALLDEALRRGRWSVDLLRRIRERSADR